MGLKSLQQQQRGAALDATDTKGRTAAHVATMHDHLDVIEVILSAGADMDKGDDQGDSPLHFAISQGKDRISETLLKKHAGLTVSHAQSGKKKKGISVLTLMLAMERPKLIRLALQVKATTPEDVRTLATKLDKLHVAEEAFS